MTSKPQYRKKLPYTSFGGPDPRLDNPYFWNEVTRWAIGLQFYPNYSAEIGGSRFQWGIPGWMRDIHCFWHRGRYGWCHRDTWSLDNYLNRVLAGALEHLAQHSQGVPAGFPEGADTWVPPRSAEVSGTGSDDVDARFALWQATLREWAKVFSEDPQDVAIFDRPDYTKHRAEEDRRREALHKALKEIEVYYEALWD